MPVRASHLVPVIALICLPSALPMSISRPTAAQPSREAVADTSNLQFHSSFWLNLHHVLYAAAWDRRPEAGSPGAHAAALPTPLEAPMAEAERGTWNAAVDHYDERIASRDLLFDRGMERIKLALAEGRLEHDAVDDGLRRALEAAAPLYRRHFWADHDRVNREWIAAVVPRVRDIAPRTIERLERFYGERWFTRPVRVDVVWVGNRQGAYTSINPPHITISSGAGDLRGWLAAEIVFHEASHVLVLPLQRALNDELGPRAREHGVLWHVIQFYATGAAVQQALRARGVEFEPYLYATGLFDRAWPRYRKAVEASWQPFVEGRITREEAIARTIAALPR